VANRLATKRSGIASPRWIACVRLAWAWAYGIQLLRKGYSNKWVWFVPGATLTKTVWAGLISVK